MSKFIKIVFRHYPAAKAAVKIIRKGAEIVESNARDRKIKKIARKVKKAAKYIDDATDFGFGGI